MKPKKTNEKAQGKKPERQDDEELLPDAEDGDDEDSRLVEEAKKFFEEQEMARIGVINHVRLSKRTLVKDGLVDNPMNAEKVASGVPSHEQQLLESFFIPFDHIRRDPEGTGLAPDAVAQHRIDHVRPYTDSSEESKNEVRGDDGKLLLKKEWHNLSLKHRLNLIEGLQEIEDHEPNTFKKEWNTLKDRAGAYREKLVEGQSWREEPKNWEEYNGGNTERKARKDPAQPRGGGTEKGDDDDDDDDNDGSDGPGTSAQKPQEATKKTKVQPDVWTEEHQTYLQQLVDGTQEDEESRHEEEAEEDVPEPEKEEAAGVEGEDTQESGGHGRPAYTWLELEMIEHFMAARNKKGRGPWSPKSLNMKDLARAHELFFRRWPLPGLKNGKRVPPRQPQSMYRKLIKAEFKGRFKNYMSKNNDTDASNPKNRKGKGGDRKVKDGPEVGAKTVPGGKKLPGDEDDEDDDDDEGPGNPEKANLNGKNYSQTARKGPAKSSLQTEEMVQNEGQDDDSDSDVEDNDAGGILDEEDQQQDVDMGMEMREMEDPDVDLDVESDGSHEPCANADDATISSSSDESSDGSSDDDENERLKMEKRDERRARRKQKKENTERIYK